MRTESSVQSDPSPIENPRTVDLIDVPLALTDYAATLRWADAVIGHGQPGYVCVCNVHTVMASQEDPELRAALMSSSLNVPDGQPLVWAINALGNSLTSRVYGPELMARACAHAAQRGHRFYLYGGRNQGALVQLALNLRNRYPGVRIVGGYSPPHRLLTGEEEAAVAEEINRSRAGCGLGRDRGPQAGEVDGADAPAPEGAAADRRRGRV